ncbi:bis-aminopropyl spermidine synthase family protein [Streptomyces sp. NPDC017979]|uniref:bis-aminopropyl spermidine synthase family protein n=1 Tax=unclassified Streptomyces TaxID=2593676 RepID=UPI0037A813CA
MVSKAAPQLRPSPGAVLYEVADAVGLQEGAPGVRGVLAAFRRLGAPAVRDVSRATSLPVPLVAAVANEFRKRGLLSKERPSRLTPEGAALTAELGMTLELSALCATCEGTEYVIPDRLRGAVEELREIMAAGPAVDLALDQSHCTAETKVRRVLALIDAGLLPGSSLVLIGDDDLVSLAIGVVGRALGIQLTSRLAVVDIAPQFLDFIADTATGLDLRVDLTQHDLRNPLPQRLRGQYDVAMTDPPYTAEGARLFLSRAVEALADGPARSIFFSFGAKGPNDMLDVQREIMDLGLVTHSFIRNFNAYEGSGILGGTGFFQHLLTTDATGLADVDEYQGPLYTRDKRRRAREYRCTECDARYEVGPGAPHSSVAELQRAGCTECGGTRFRPGTLVAEAPEGTATTEG